MSLKQLQSDYLSALWGEVAPQNLPHLFGSTWNLKGLQAYQSNAQGLAQRALSASYPVIEQLLGQTSFAELACTYWYAHPPHSGNIETWGEQLFAFIENDPQLTNQPYLKDVARLEWALHETSFDEDSELHAQSFSLLLENDPSKLALLLNPSLRLIEGASPMVDIVLAHRQLSSLDRIKPIAQTALVWREAYRPRYRAIPSDEHIFLRTLQNGFSLSQALDSYSTEFDFSAWLNDAVICQIVLGVSLLRS